MSNFDPFASGLATEGQFDPFASGTATLAPTAPNPFKVESLFAGVEKIDSALPAEAASALNAAVEGETDKATAKMRAANVAYLAQQYGKDAEEVAGRYELYRDTYASEVLRSRDPMDDAGFYGRVGQHLEKKKAERGMLQELTVSLFDAVRAGKDFDATFEEQRKARWLQPGWDAFNQDMYRKFAQEQWTQFQQKRSSLEESIAPVTEFFQVAKAKGSPEWFDQMTTAKEKAMAALERLDPNDAEMVMDFAAGSSMQQGETERGFGEKVAGRVTRGADTLFKGILGTAKEAMRQQREMDAQRFPSVFGSRDDNVPAERRRTQLERKLEQRLSGEVDPMKANGWIAEGVLAASESTPAMVASLSIPGVVANFAATKDQLRGQYEDQGLSPRNADMLAGLAAVPYSALEFVQAKMVFGGKLPGVEKFLTVPIRTGGQLAGRAALVGGIEFIEQLGQETAQNLTAPTVQSIASVFSKEIPQVDWAREWKNLANATPETAAALIPFVLVGTGNATFKDRAYGREYLRQETHLRALGLKEETIAKVMEAPTPEAAGAAITADWEMRDPAGGAEAIQELNRQAFEARAELGDILSEESLALVEKYPEVFSSLPPSQLPIEVRKPNGEIIPAVMAGWQPDPWGNGTFFATVGYKTDTGWSHGFAGFMSNKDVVVTAVPGPEEWPTGSKLIGRTNDGGYVVRDDNGLVRGVSNTAEGVAQVLRGPQTQSEPDLSTQGARLEARGQVMGDPDSETLGSVFQPGRANRATVFTKPAPGVTGSVSAPKVIEALAGVLDAGGQDGRILRFGRMGRMGKRAAGFYRMKHRIIRVKTANNIETAAHEVAHAIEDELWGIGHVWQSSKLPTASKAELHQLGVDLYGNEQPTGGYESEGFAEFFRLYVTDPEQAQKKAPAFFADWEKDILAGKPELQKAVKAAQSAGTTFYRQGSKERAKQGIATQPTRLENAREAVEAQLESARRKWIEAAQPIKDFADAVREQGINLREQDDPYATLVARRLTADSVVAYMATEGMLDFAGNVVGKPLQDAFKLVGKEKVDDFIVYLWAKRAQAIWGTGRNPGLAQVDADELVTDLESNEFIQAAQIVYDWNNGVLNYAAQSSPDFATAVAKIRATDPGFYIPLFREFKALDDRYASRGGARGGSLTKHLKGSGRRIKDPVESMLQQAKQTVLKSHQKAVLDQILRIGEQVPGMGAYITEVPRDQLAQVVPQWQVIKGVVDAIEAKAGTKVAGTIEKALEGFLDGDAFTFFTPAFQPKQNENPVLPIFRNGELKWFEMDAELYKALSGMDLYRLPRVLDLFLGVPARNVRLGTTGLRASFSLVTNPLRDLRTLQMNSQASANPAQLFGYWMGSMKDLAISAVTFGKVTNEWSDLAERLGVEMAQPLTQDSRPLEAAARKLKRGGAWSPLDMRDNMDLIRNFLQFPETASRLAEMKAVAKDIGWDPSQPLTARIAAKLVTAGKQVTTDFTQAGEYARVINQAIPFFNASLQGPVAHIRALKRDPAKFALRGLMGTAAALALWFRNKDEEWWKEMQAKERYLYSYFQVGDQLIRIPRSYEVDGVFMAMTEALADAWYQAEPETAGKWFTTFLSNVSQIDMVQGVPVPPLPVLANLGAQQLANRDFFFDSPIVPRGELDNVRPSEQYNEFTSTVAIKVGELFNVSPRRIDFTIRNLFGPVGTDIATLFGRGTGKESPVERDAQAADFPVLGTLFQRGGAVARNPESVEKLYDAYEEALQIQRSKREKETREQRDMRVMLQDAVRAQAALSLISRNTGDEAKRKEVDHLRLTVARSAVQMAESKQIDRSLNRRILAEASREAEKIKRQQGER